MLVFPDVRAALDWLTEVFDFTERLRIGEARRSQLQADADGAVIVADVGDDQVAPDPGAVTHLIKVRVEDVDAQVERAPRAWRALDGLPAFAQVYGGRGGGGGIELTRAKPSSRFRVQRRVIRRRWPVQITSSAGSTVTRTVTLSRTAFE